MYLDLGATSQARLDSVDLSYGMFMRSKFHDAELTAVSMAHTDFSAAGFNAARLMGVRADAPPCYAS